VLQNSTIAAKIADQLVQKAECRITGNSFNTEERQCRSQTPVPVTAVSLMDQAVLHRTGNGPSRT